MKRIFFLYGLMVLGCCLAGCASAQQISVNGYTGAGAGPVAIIPGRSFAVVENQQAQNPLLEQEIREKLVKLLSKHGFPIAPYDQADYHLFFSYGIGGDRNVSVALPDGYCGGLGLGLGGGACRSSYVFVAPFAAYYPFTETVYDRWLLLNVVDAGYYRQKGEFRTVWVGEARSRGPSSDLRVLINYLLLADFKKFGQNTGKAVTVDINDYDAQVYGLTQ